MKTFAEQKMTKCSLIMVLYLVLLNQMRFGCYLKGHTLAHQVIPCIFDAFLITWFYRLSNSALAAEFGIYTCNPLSPAQCRFMVLGSAVDEDVSLLRP